MLLLQPSAHLPIGVDLGFDSVKLLQLERSGASLSIVAAAHCTILEADRANALDRVAHAVGKLPALLGGNPFVGKRIVACMPRELVQIKTLRLPVLPESELRSAIEFEANQLFQNDTDRLTIRFLPAGEVKQGNEMRLEVIVLAVENKAIETFLELFNGVGLTLDALEFEPCAAYRGVERFLRRKDDESVVNVLVDVGSRQSQVVIGRGRDVTFVKSIDIGGKYFNDCVARKLAVSIDEARELRQRYAHASANDPAKEAVRRTIIDATRHAMDELAREVSLCLRYYSVTFRGQRPAKVLVHGGEGNDPTLRAALASFINIPIELRYPMAGIGSKEASGGHCLNFRSEWGIAVGNAMKRVTGLIEPAAEPQYFGRRESDAPLVEVVDLNQAIALPQTPDISPSRIERRKAEVAVA